MTIMQNGYVTASNEPRILNEVVHPRSPEVMRAFGRWCGIEQPVIDAAVDNVFSGRATGILMSGPQASGKDTVCPEVTARAGIETVHCRVAHAIRAEIDEALAAMRAGSSPRQAVNEIVDRLQVPEMSAVNYVELLFEDCRRDPELSSESRTPAMRRVLQHHGAEARADRPGYWVKITYQTVFDHLAHGRSVHLTDGRFLTEIDAGRVSGLFCVRLFVPLAVRVERIRLRDGLIPDEDTLRHPGETAADGYWGVDLEIENRAELGVVAEVIRHRFDAHRERMVTH